MYATLEGGREVQFIINLPPGDYTQKATYLGFDSVTSYVWIHHVALPEFPVTPICWRVKPRVMLVRSCHPGRSEAESRNPEKAL